MKLIRVIFLLFAFFAFGYQLFDELLKSYKFYETEALVFIVLAILTLYLIFKNNQILDSKEWKELKHIGIASLIIYFLLSVYTLIIIALLEAKPLPTNDVGATIAFIIMSTIFLMPALVRSTYFWRKRVEMPTFVQNTSFWRRRVVKKAKLDYEVSKKHREEVIEKNKREANERKKEITRKSVEKENREIWEAEVGKKYGKEVLSAYKKRTFCKGMPLSLVEEVMGPAYERRQTSRYTRYRFGRYYTSDDDGGDVGLDLGLLSRKVNYRVTIYFVNGLCDAWEEPN